MKARILCAFAAAGLLAACGTNPQERVSGGAAAGAATGAAVGALAGPPGVVAGALIGGGAGATTGAVTSPRDVNLGRPVWDNPEVRVPGVREGGSYSMRSSPQTRRLQAALNRHGYDAGPADGIYGPHTRQAVMDYQRQNNMQPTGMPTRQMMASLGMGGGEATGSDARNPNAAYMGGGAVGGGSGMGSNNGNLHPADQMAPGGVPPANMPTSPSGQPSSAPSEQTGR